MHEEQKGNTHFQTTATVLCYLDDLIRDENSHVSVSNDKFEVMSAVNHANGSPSRLTTSTPITEPYPSHHSSSTFHFSLSAQRALLEYAAQALAQIWPLAWCLLALSRLTVSQDSAKFRILHQSFDLVFATVAIDGALSALANATALRQGSVEQTDWAMRRSGRNVGGGRES